MRKFFLLLIICVPLFILSGCEATQAKPSTDINYDPVFQNREKLTAFENNINIILNLINNNDLESAQRHFDAIEKQTSASDEIVLLAYTHSQLLMAQDHQEEAYQRLNNPTIQQHLHLSNIQTQLNAGLLNSEILSYKKLYLEALKTSVHLANLIKDDSLYLKNHLAIWDTLNHINDAELKTSLKNHPDQDLQKWLELNALYRNKEIPLDIKITAIDTWLIQNPNHPASIRTPEDINSLKFNASKNKEKIAVLLPFQGKYAALADAIRDGVMYSYFETHAQADIRFYNVGENQPFLNIYKQAVADGATLIIGPLFKNQLEELLTQDTLPVKTIALNNVASQKVTTNLFQFSLAPDDEILSIIDHSTQSKLTNAFVLAQNDEFSQKNMSTFIQVWKQLNNNVIVAQSFSESMALASELEKPLNIIKSKDRSDTLQNLLQITLEHNPKSRTDIDMVMLFTKPDNAADINLLLNSYLPNNTVKYSNSAIYRGYPDSEIDQTLNSIIFTDMPLIINTKDNKSKKYKNSTLIRMYAFGMDAYQLSERLNVMSGNAPAVFEGATGIISLSNNEFTRKPSFAIFSNGLAIPLTQVNAE